MIGGLKTQISLYTIKMMSDVNVAKLSCFIDLS